MVVSDLDDNGGINTVKVVYRGLNYSVNPQINVYGNPNATGGSIGEERLVKLKMVTILNLYLKKRYHTVENMEFYHKDDNFNQFMKKLGSVMKINNLVNIY